MSAYGFVHTWTGWSQVTAVRTGDGTIVGTATYTLGAGDGATPSTPGWLRVCLRCGQVEQSAVVGEPR